MFTTTDSSSRSIQNARVVANTPLCREHYHLTLELKQFPNALAGQFVHLCPALGFDGDGAVDERVATGVRHASWTIMPLLRRAFSIAGLRRGIQSTEIDVVYRVVGAGTRWMESLRPDNQASVLGPLGNAFPIVKDKPQAWLVAGGVGLPPMLWLAEKLLAAGKEAIAFCGAQSRDLLALTLDPSAEFDPTASRPVTGAAEFARSAVPVVISTDDGSIGFAGRVGQAVEAYHEANPVSSDRLVVYTCGPEPMMHAVAEYCRVHDIECHVCVERNMACGLGTCQSCVVPVADDADRDGWSYRLCCTDGPVFDARRILWKEPQWA
jgi:dihydroorotate dehydrogenase electron transfer subunit